MYDGLLVFILLMLGLIMALYVIRVVTLYKLMSYAGMTETWWAFIPGTEYLIFYKLLDGTISTKGKLWSAKKTRDVFLRLPYYTLFGYLVISFLLMMFKLEIAGVFIGNIASIVFAVAYGMIGYYFSRVYLKKKSPVGAILGVLLPNVLFIYILMNMSAYRDSVDRFQSNELDDDVKPVTDVETIDNETLEELFTDVKVDNAIGSGIHLTKVSDTEKVVDEDAEETARKVEIAQALFDAEVAAMEAEKEYEEYSSDALEADLKALEAEFELAKVEEDERLRVEAERVAKEAESAVFADSLEIDVDGDEEIEVVESSDVVGSVYGSSEVKGKSFTYDNEIDLNDSDNDSDK